MSLQQPLKGRTPMPGPKQNDLLAALSATELRRLRPHLYAVYMTLGDFVYESFRHIDHVYCPTN